MATTIATVDLAGNKLLSVAHGRAEGAPIRFATTGVLPSALGAGLWYVRNPGTDDFQVSRARTGGEVVTFGDVGSGVLQVFDAPLPPAVVLFDDVKAYFATRGMGELVVFGPAEVTKTSQGQGRAARVAFVPGDEQGKLGKLGPMKNTSPSAIFGFGETVEIHCWARDGAASKNDYRAHYAAAWDLFEIVLRAIRETRLGRVTFLDVRRTTEPVESVFGVEIILPVVLDGLVLAGPNAVVNPTTPDFSSAMAFPSGDYVTPTP